MDGDVGWFMSDMSPTQIILGMPSSHQIKSTIYQCRIVGFAKRRKNSMFLIATSTQTGSYFMSVNRQLSPKAPEQMSDTQSPPKWVTSQKINPPPHLASEKPQEPHDLLAHAASGFALLHIYSKRLQNIA